MKLVVRAVQVVAVVCTLVFVVMLFANDPDDGGSGEVAEADGGEPDTGGDGETGDEVDGAEVFGDRCASCHGRDGDGGVGPQLADGRVVERFPDVADQIAVVTDGRSGMPAFGSRLSAEEIEAVVEYTRSL